MSVADLPPKRTEGLPVADDFTGTNSDKIDKLAAAVTDLRATLRSYSRIASFLLPSLVAFFAYVVVALQTTSTRLDRLSDRVEFAERLTKERFDAVALRLDTLEKRVEIIEKQQRETNDRLTRVEERLGRMEEQLRRLADKLDRPAGK